MKTKFVFFVAVMTSDEEKIKHDGLGMSIFQGGFCFQVRALAFLLN